MRYSRRTAQARSGVWQAQTLATRSGDVRRMLEPADSVPTTARRRHRFWIVALSVLLLVGVVAWSARRTILTGAGRLLVAEDPLARVDLVVVSSANPLAGAFEAARLYHDGISATILLMAEPSDAVDDAIEQLGVRRPRGSDTAEVILERSGVPAGAIRIPLEPVDGTDTEITELSSFARQQHLESVLFITARSHTRRARWLLRRKLPSDTRPIVRSSRFDTFAPDSWWQARGESREVAMEYLRWVNTILLGDLWGRPAPAARG